MMFKKIATVACLASAMLVVSAPASAAAYLIGGKWYYFSLDYDATLKKVTGKELNAVLQVGSTVTVIDSQVLCGNPRGAILNPGKGPQLLAGGITDPFNDQDVEKSDRSKSTFKKTLKVELPKSPQVNTCDSPANSANGEWQPLYWQNKGCLRGDEISPPGEVMAMCYSDFAYENADGSLYYVTGPLKGSQVGLKSDWTFVFLPTKFTYTSVVYVGGTPTTAVTGECTFEDNPSPLAVYPSTPYSLDNPPVDGWAKVKTPYVCSETPTTP